MRGATGLAADVLMRRASTRGQDRPAAARAPSIALVDKLLFAV